MAQNTLSEVLPWELVADGYAVQTAPVFEKWALDSIRRVRPEKDHVAIDVATGPGTVARVLSPMVKHVVALDFSKKMIGHLEKEIVRRKIPNISRAVCDCQSLPCSDASFDLAFSQFGLMFFPDRVQGFREMFRVLKPGGKAAVYSWAPICESSAMTAMMGALFAGFPESKPKETEARTIVFGLDNLETFRSEMSQAGFRDITFESIVHEYPHQDVEGTWARMTQGSAPVALMKSRLSEKEWAEKEKVSIQYLREHCSFPLKSTAYLGIGVKG